MKRLALLLFVAFLALQGCNSDNDAGGTSGGSHGDLASVSVSPSRASVAVGAMRSFTAAGHDFDGRTVPIDPVWSVNPWSLGRIDQDGNLLANCIRDSGVVKATASGKWSGTSIVTIVAGSSNAPVSLALEPDTLTVDAGGAFAQVYVTALDADGAPVAVVPEWQISPRDLATVSDFGLVMSGDFPGQGQVIANYAGLSAHSRLIVRSAKAGRGTR